MASEDRERLIAFVRAAKNAGASDDFLVDLLKQNGWSERRIYGAFSDYYAQATGAPVPSRGQGMENARDAFLYLVSFASLGFWSIALIWLANIVITRDFPSPTDVESVTSLRYDLAGQLASIIIGFPIFMLVSWLLARQTAHRPEALDSAVRKWLTYIALVIAVIALISDAVLFLQSFLTGELTVRFALQYVVLIVVAGGIFSYYLGSVRTGGERASHALFGGLALVAVVAALVVGFTGVGTPGFERSVGLDGRRVSDLYVIAQRIQDRGSLPRTLSALPIDASRLRDPATHFSYGYVHVNGKRYQLCATFDTASSPNAPAGASSNFWEHPSGRHCFQLSGSSQPPFPGFP